jgi:hypothetical protein
MPKRTDFETRTPHINFECGLCCRHPG